MPAVPGDEIGRGEDPGQLFAQDPEPTIDTSAASEDHRVVVTAQSVERDIRADHDVANEPDARILEDLGERRRDRLDLLMVRGDPVPDEAVRSRQALVDVDAGVE